MSPEEAPGCEISERKDEAKIPLLLLLSMYRESVGQEGELKGDIWRGDGA